MSDSNNVFFTIVAKLVLISVIAAVLLGVTYVPTQEQLKKNELQAMNNQLSQVIPNAQFEPVYGTSVNPETGEKTILYYQAKDTSGKLLGYAFIANSQGHKGEIAVIGGIDPQYSKLVGISILSQQETPGLGSRIIESQWTNQFKDIPVEKIKLKNEGGAIDGITGATVSSKAVMNALNNKIDSMKGGQ